MPHLLNMSEIISTSVSAAAIFSVEETCGLLPKRNDISSILDRVVMSKKRQIEKQPLGQFGNEGRRVW